MSRCFISYRHVSPDQELAHAVGAALARNGHLVFLDTKLEVGTRWVDEIERELKSAEVFVVLLSEQAIRSDMLRQEVALAHQLSAEKKLSVLPIRVAYTETLPYDLAAYLNPFQYSLWNEGESFDSVCADIEAAVNHRAGLPQQAKAHAAAANCAVIQFDAESLDRLARELAVFVGPVARVLVNRAAKGSHSWHQLYDALAEEVPSGPERRNFLAKRNSH
jgi:hypothetical protein